MNLLKSKPLKSPWFIISKVGLIIGAAFLAATLVFFVLRAQQPDQEVFPILAINFGIQGAVWFCLGLGFLIYAKKKTARLERLKTEGREFQAEIVALIHSAAVRVGSGISARAECSYVNEEGRTCLVRSGLLLLTSGCDKEYLKAVVYVSREDPRDYAVEISPRVSEREYDYDYR